MLRPTTSRLGRSETNWAKASHRHAAHQCLDDTADENPEMDKTSDIPELNAASGESVDSAEIRSRFRSKTRLSDPAIFVRKVVGRRSSSSSSDGHLSIASEPLSEEESDEGAEWREALEARPDYQKLRGICSKRWKEEYVKRSEDDQDMAVADYAVDVEVAARSSEGQAHWDKLFEDCGKTDGFVIDWIVSPMKRKIGEGLSKEVLIKFTDYPIPSWEKKSTIGNDKTTVCKNAMDRAHDLDLIEICLREQLGIKKYDKTFPNRYLQHEKGEGNGGYIMNKRSRYVNRLRATESRWNFVCDRADLPHIYIEDWTGIGEDHDTIAALEFSAYLVNTPEVEEMLGEEGKQMEDVICGRDCTCAGGRGGGEGGRCCGEEASKPIKHRALKPYLEGSARCLSVPTRVECGERCRCGEKCENRRLQKGRQHVLCLFREPSTGWGVRTMSEMERGEYVSEYVGEVQVGETKGRKSVYDFSMPFPARDEEGAKRSGVWTIAAGCVGNETRFFNHSCSPNMETITTVVERHGLYYTHVAFYACRKIMAGEQLTFDYFPDLNRENADTSSIFHNCRCGSKRCRFPAADNASIPSPGEKSLFEKGKREEEEGKEERHALRRRVQEWKEKEREKKISAKENTKKKEKGKEKKVEVKKEEEKKGREKIGETPKLKYIKEEKNEWKINIPPKIETVTLSDSDDLPEMKEKSPLRERSKKEEKRKKDEEKKKKEKQRKKKEEEERNEKEEKERKKKEEKKKEEEKRKEDDRKKMKEKERKREESEGEEEPGPSNRDHHRERSGSEQDRQPGRVRQTARKAVGRAMMPVIRGGKRVRTRSEEEKYEEKKRHRRSGLSPSDSESDNSESPVKARGSETLMEKRVSGKQKNGDDLKKRKGG